MNDSVLVLILLLSEEIFKLVSQYVHVPLACDWHSSTDQHMLCAECNTFPVSIQWNHSMVVRSARVLS